MIGITCAVLAFIAGATVARHQDAPQRASAEPIVVHDEDLFAPPRPFDRRPFHIALFDRQRLVVHGPDGAPVEGLDLRVVITDDGRKGWIHSLRSDHEGVVDVFGVRSAGYPDTEIVAALCPPRGMRAPRISLAAMEAEAISVLEVPAVGWLRIDVVRPDGTPLRDRGTLTVVPAGSEGSPEATPFADAILHPWDARSVQEVACAIGDDDVAIEIDRRGAFSQSVARVRRPRFPGEIVDVRVVLGDGAGRLEGRLPAGPSTRFALLRSSTADGTASGAAGAWKNGPLFATPWIDDDRRFVIDLPRALIGEEVVLWIEQEGGEPVRAVERRLTATGDRHDLGDIELAPIEPLLTASSGGRRLDDANVEIVANDAPPESPDPRFPSRVVTRPSGSGFAFHGPRELEGLPVRIGVRAPGCAPTRIETVLGASDVFVPVTKEPSVWGALLLELREDAALFTVALAREGDERRGAVFHRPTHSDVASAAARFAVGGIGAGRYTLELLPVHGDAPATALATFDWDGETTIDLGDVAVPHRLMGRELEVRTALGAPAAVYRRTAEGAWVPVGRNAPDRHRWRAVEGSTDELLVIAPAHLWTRFTTAEPWTTLELPREGSLHVDVEGPFQDLPARTQLAIALRPPATDPFPEAHGPYRTRVDARGATRLAVSWAGDATLVVEAVGPSKVELVGEFPLVLAPADSDARTRIALDRERVLAAARRVASD